MRVSFDFNVSYSSCWCCSLINTSKLKNKKSCTAAAGEPIWDPGVFTIIIIFSPFWWLSYNKLFYLTESLNGLAHSAIIKMRLALPLHTLQPYTLICRYMAPLTPWVPLLYALDQQLIVSSAAPLTSLILVNREASYKHVCCQWLCPQWYYHWPWYRYSRGGWKSFAGF